MASHSVPIPISREQSRVRALVPRGTLPLGAAVAFFVALLVLFGWLHFILSLQVAETNQQIQDSANLLEGFRRTNATLREQVARAQSPRRMQSEAIAAGYQPRQPVHILLSGASSHRALSEIAPGTPPPPDTLVADTSESHVSSILEAILAEFDTWW